MTPEQMTPATGFSPSGSTASPDHGPLGLHFIELEAALGSLARLVEHKPLYKFEDRDKELIHAAIDLLETRIADIKATLTPAARDRLFEFYEAVRTRRLDALQKGWDR